MSSKALGYWPTVQRTAPGTIARKSESANRSAAQGTRPARRADVAAARAEAPTMVRSDMAAPIPGVSAGVPPLGGLRSPNATLVRGIQAIHRLKAGLQRRCRHLLFPK